MKIFIDADGCPVVKNTIRIGIKYGLKLIVVKNHAVHIENTHPEHVEVVTVDKSRDSADYYIANRLSPGDLVVTQDYGLAAMVMSKHGLAINQNGMVYSTSNIDLLLDRRHMNQEMRRKHKKHTSKFKKRTQKDNENFENALIDFIKGHKA
ncbi:YaiI/YqxD family protein [Fusibacter sp. JL216-2]|uniref:YaiI/YqxD family protein n=1 Tax=Fusibacter sp. JL216-2 TaxID=3071453 RepID=UPI003D3417E8